MAKKIKILDAKAIVSRFRYHCNTCGNTGTWRGTQNEAEIDGERHVEIPKNQNHIVMIETEVKTARALK